MSLNYQISDEFLESEFKYFYDSFYSDTLSFLDRVNKNDDFVQFLNSINAETFGNLFTKAFRKLSSQIELSLNKIFSYALNNEKLESEIRNKYRNKIISSEEIYNYLDSNCPNLWQELVIWSKNHQSFITYHNESEGNTFNAAYGAGAIGGTLGSVLGPVGGLVGAALGGYLAGSSLQSEYDSNYKLMINHYQKLLNEYDNTWKLIYDNLLPNILDEVEIRYEQIKEENYKLLKEKEEQKKMSKIDNTKYLPLPNSNLNKNSEITQTNSSKNNPIVYILSSALVFLTIFVLLILTKVIHIN